MKISVDRLSVRFHTGVEVLREVSFEVASGELVTLVGPSDCGKSTTLNTLAALLPHDEATVTGRMIIDGVEVRQGARAGPLGYVFQRDANPPRRCG